MAGKRPRIQPKIITPNEIEDELEFKENKCSKNARKIIIIHENLQLELWYDQHYIRTRYQHGEDNGERREGIEPEDVEGLVKKSIPHLLCYGAKIKSFNFLNHENEAPIRVVLIDSNYDVDLNIAVEVHLITLNKYEITVKTAMRKNDFRIDNGKYAIQIIGENQSILKKQEGKSEIEVSSIEI